MFLCGFFVGSWGALIVGAATIAYWRKYRDRADAPDDYYDTVVAGFVFAGLLLAIAAAGPIALVARLVLR